jgi:hypothetical protein
MGKIEYSDKFTTNFLETIDRVEESKELAEFKENAANGRSNEKVEMSDTFQKDVLTVVKAIKICDMKEEEASKLDFTDILSSFLVSSVALYTGIAVQTNERNLTALLVSIGVAVLPWIAALGYGHNQKKEAINDRETIKSATDLDDKTIIAILKQMASEGIKIAEAYLDYFTKQQNKGVTLK